MKEQKEKRSKSNTGGMCLVFIIIMLVVLVLGVLDTANRVNTAVTNVLRDPDTWKPLSTEFRGSMNVAAAIAACELADGIFESARIAMPTRDCEARAYQQATGTARAGG